MSAPTMPHSLESEECLLGCALIDPAYVLDRCIEARITPDSFYDPKHGLVYERLLDLHQRRVAIDITVLAEDLKAAKQLDPIGGFPFLLQISSTTSTTAQSGYFIEKVRELALIRALIRAGTVLIEDSYAFSSDIEAFLDQAEQKLFAVTQQRVKDRSEATAQLVEKARAQLAAMASRRGELTGLRTGFQDLDQLTWGFQKSDLIILAARPSMGKTACALNIAEAVALPLRGPRKTVLVFSLEMSATQLMTRMLCSRGRVNLKLLRDGMLSKNGAEQQRIDEAADELAHAPIIIDDSSSISVPYIRAKARRAHARTPLSFIIVDYLQLIAPSDRRIPREQQVAEASRGLKALAKELDLPVLVLAQLNRSSEKENRPPRLSDLRESGSVEQDADVVLFLARPKDADDTFQVAGDTADLIVAKQRNGPVGSLKLTFLRDITRFENFHQ